MAGATCEGHDCPSSGDWVPQGSPCDVSISANASVCPDCDVYVQCGDVNYTCSTEMTGTPPDDKICRNYCVPCDSTKTQLLPAAATGGKGNGANKASCVTYECPAGEIAGCNNAAGHGVGNPNSLDCQVGDYIYCYCTSSTPTTMLPDASTKVGARKASCVTYECPAGQTAGCNNAEGHGVGSPNSSNCQVGDYIYCSD